MKKRITWKEGDLISLKLRDDLHTIAQMLRSPYMRFFKLKSRDGQWRDVDLDQVEELFTVLVGNVVLQKLAEGKIKDPSVRPSRAPFEKHWLRPKIHVGGGYPFRGAELVAVDPNVGYSQAPVLKASVTLEQDREAIERYELTNMWGDEDLRQRLITYFDTGKHRNLLKEKVFGIS